jgi:branched-chain amino acid transport system substrate-binding protein
VANTDPVKVGVLFSRAGATSCIETSQLAGTHFAIREINDAGGIDGRELMPVYYDPQSLPLNYKTLATRLVRDDKVNVIFGCYMSSQRKAVIPVVERWHRLLMYPTIYEGFEFSGNVVYTGAAPNQNSAQLAEYMTRNFGARVYLIGSSYIYPYESNRIMSDFILERPGGAKLAERYVKLDANEEDFARVVAEIKDKQPDWVFSTVVGSGTRMLYEAYAEAGLDPAQMPIASLTTCEAETSEMSPQVAAGHITAAPYFQSIDTDARCSAIKCNRTWAGKRLTFRCTCSPTRCAKPVVTMSITCCPSCWEASSTRPRGACASTRAITTRDFIRGSDGPIPRVASLSWRRRRTGSIQIRIWSIMLPTS